MEAQSHTTDLADFSSISVELSSKRRNSFFWKNFEPVFLGFWISHHLKASYVKWKALGWKILGLVVLNKKGIFVAESTDGVVLRSTLEKRSTGE